MKEELVSYDIAVMLKEKGFDWDTRYFYQNDVTHPFSPESGFVSKVNDIVLGYYIDGRNGTQDLNHNSEYSTSTPSLSLAAKWLRDVHNINVDVFYNPEQDTYETHIKYQGNTNYYNPNNSKYEQALSIGIKEALKLI